MNKREKNRSSFRSWSVGLVIVVALAATPENQRRAVSLLTQATTRALAGVASLLAWQIERAEQQASAVQAREAELKAASAADSSRARELADTTAEVLAAKVAVGEGLRALEGIRTAVEEVEGVIGRARGYVPQDRQSQAARVREARLAEQAAAARENEVRVANAHLEATARREAERAARLEQEIERSVSLAIEAGQSLAEARRDAERAQAHAVDLSRKLDAEAAGSLRSAATPASTCGVPGNEAAKTQPRRVVRTTLRVHTEGCD